MRARLLVAFLAASCVAFAGDSEFNHVVKAIEAHYGLKATHIPFLEMASIFIKVARPAGASEFRLAVFENLETGSPAREPSDLDHFMRGLSDHGLHPLVRVHSRRDGGASTYIYLTEAGRSTQLLIAAFEHDHATVIQVKANLATLLKTIEDPERTAKSLSEADGQ